ncbi:PP2C family protein-serine/threonine phosphatase [Rhodoferax sp.]|uniref:PP2C family protein-serine/threonine phosphatase n=1 Tax=Rhodoferax sp. TaxID=50421 RepID=UPI00277374E9|nr:serine/threonine-protein phosphatase [Rhodoferax sp.]
MRITFSSFSQRGSGKAHNEDAVLLDDSVHQGRVRECGETDLSQPRYFAVADGVAIGTRPRTASRHLLELLQVRLNAAAAAAPLGPLLHGLQHDYAALSANTDFQGMAATLVGVRVVGSVVTIFNVGDSRAYLLANDNDGCQAHLLTRDHSVLNDMIDDGEITPEQSEDAASFMRGLTSQFIVDAEFDDFKVSIATHEWRAGERLLLCSDGLNEVLTDRQFAALLVGNSLEDLLNACKASRRAGGTDDFSVIVLERLD